jgi:damage-control phosphatase, subfamily III
VDPNNPPWPAYRGYHEYSFAYATMGVRLPTILGKAIEDTIRTLNEQSSEDKIVDLVHCIERMDSLMTDLSGNAELRPIVDDGEAYVASWNKEIAWYNQRAVTHSVHVCNTDHHPDKDYMNAPWLFAEAYKYRRLHEAFSVSKHWGDYDVFYRQKVKIRLLITRHTTFILTFICLV